MGKQFSESARAEIFEKSGGKCWYCGTGRASQVEHQTPEKRGGSHDAANLVGACIECNRRKAGHGVSGNPNWTLEEYRLQVAAALGLPPAELKFYGERLDALRREVLEQHPRQLHTAILRGRRDELLRAAAQPLPDIDWRPPYVRSPVSLDEEDLTW